MLELKEVFAMVSQKVEPDLDAVREQERRQRRAARNRKVGAYILTAAMTLATIAVIVDGQSGPNGKSPEPAANPAGTAAENVARDLVLALGAFDANQAMSTLADDADVAGLVTSLGDEGLSGTPDELPLLLSMLEAMRFEESIGFCEETGSLAPESDVRCPFSFYLLGSDAFGRGAFRGSYLDATVRDGEIVRASAHWDTERLSPLMWEPFARWVSRVYPGDAEQMYEDETHGAARLTSESIRLWGQRVREFVTIFATSSEGSPRRVTRVVGGTAFSFRLPTPWEVFGTTSINKSIIGPQGAEAIMFWTMFPEEGNLEQCAKVLGPNIVPTAADMAAAFAMAPGTKLISGPSNMTIGGHPAKEVAISVVEDVGCDPGYFYSWTDFYKGAFWPETGVGDLIRVWVIDLGGKLLVIEAETNEQADAELQQEIGQIVGSIRFE